MPDNVLRLNKANPVTGLPSQMSTNWIDDTYAKMKITGDPNKVILATKIEAAQSNGKLEKMVIGVNTQGQIVLIRLDDFFTGI